MKHMQLTILALAASLALGMALTPGVADAVERYRIFSTNATGHCQAALPVFEGNIRKRPLAVQNEGGNNAFVTCSYLSQKDIIVATMNVHNDGAVAQNLACTGVSGTHNGSDNEYVVKTVSIPSNGTRTMQWLPSDFSGAPTVFPDSRFSISCNLLPGIGLNVSALGFYEDVG